MATIVTRAGKGSPLTHNEVDANFTNLNTAKAELASPALTGNVTVASNSATASVTITQIGAGNALVVEDSASPDATPFVVTATGSVGVGTATPATLLHLSSVDPVFITMIDQGNSAGRVGQSGTAMTFGVDGVNGATERMRIDTSGNVGIGTSSPTSNLHVYNANSAISTNEVAAAGTGVASTRWKYGTNQFGLYVGPTNALIAYDYGAAAERMRINASGNVGIGTTTPTSKLHVEGTTTGGGTEPDAIAYFKQNAVWTASEPWALYVSGYSYLNGFRINADDGIRSLYKTAAGGTLGFAVTGDDPITFTQSNNTERMRIAAGGNVGIGTTTPASKLDVNGIIRDAAGDIRDLVNNAKTAAYVLVVTDNGELINITTGGVTVNASIFSAGQNVTIYNNSASPQTITQGTSVTLRLAGTALTGNRTLAQRGIATMLCVGANEFACSGAGLS